jgi:hypothetical protein
MSSDRPWQGYPPSGAFGPSALSSCSSPSASVVSVILWRLGWADDWPVAGSGLRPVKQKERKHLDTAHDRGEENIFSVRVRAVPFDSHAGDQLRVLAGCVTIGPPVRRSIPDRGSTSFQHHKPG